MFSVRLSPPSQRRGYPEAFLKIVSILSTKNEKKHQAEQAHILLGNKVAVCLSLDHNPESNPYIPEWEMAEWPDPLGGEIARPEVTKLGWPSICHVLGVIKADHCNYTCRFFMC